MLLWPSTRINRVFISDLTYTIILGEVSTMEPIGHLLILAVIPDALSILGIMIMRLMLFTLVAEQVITCVGITRRPQPELLLPTPIL